MSDLLNARQRAAVRHLDGPLLVLAGAGSGKTRVITHKIAYLIERAGIAAARIVAVTFTNKAAREMKQRVSGLLENRQTRGLTISTFHTLGLNMLRRECHRVGLRPGFSVFDEQDCEHLLKDIAQQLAQDKERLRLVRVRIGGWKNALQPPDVVFDRANSETDAWQAAVYRDYQHALRAYNAVDFDDLIFYPVELLRTYEDLRDQAQNDVRYLLVDEYQDTNTAQYTLIKLLIGVRGALTAVGDDDQSIYAWRGARPENLALLQQDMPGLRVIKLEQNYRSTGRILRTANALIKHNQHLFGKRLWSELGLGEPIRVLECKDDDHEAERIVSEILHHKFLRRTSLNDYAVLYRGNHQARCIEKALRTQGIPYHLSGGSSFFNRTEIKDTMAYLRLLANPDDDAAFLRTVNTPRREIGPKTLERLAAYASRRGTALRTACEELGVEEIVSARALKRLREFGRWLDHLARDSAGTPATLVRQLLRDIDYEDWLLQTSPNEKAAKRRWENVQDLVGWLDRLSKDEARGASLDAMVNHLSLMDILERQDEEADGERVRLMTLHAAKGLEFSHVYIAGLEEELLPHRVSVEEDRVEEERRLAYVGITRAQQTLTLTFCARRRRGGELSACEPSRFLLELPAEDLSWQGTKDMRSSEERKQQGSAHLANLKTLLDS